LVPAVLVGIEGLASGRFQSPELRQHHTLRWPVRTAGLFDLLKVFMKLVLLLGGRFFRFSFDIDGSPPPCRPRPRCRIAESPPKDTHSFIRGTVQVELSPQQWKKLIRGSTDTRRFTVLH